MAVRGRVLAVAAVLVALAGCTRTISGAGRFDGPTAFAPLTRSAAVTIADDYDTRNNTANKAKNAEQLARIETGSALRIDLIGYRIYADRPFGEIRTSDRHYHLPALPLGAPKWFVVDATDTTSDTANLYVFIDTGAGWKVERIGHGAPGDRPSLQDRGGVATALTRADLAELPVSSDQATAAVVAALTGGTAPTGVELETGAGLRRLQNVVAKPDPRVQATARATARTGPLYALRSTDGGALVFVQLDYQRTLTATGGGTLVVAGTVDETFLGPAPRRAITEQFLVLAALQLPGKGGAVTVVGAYSGLLTAR
jgi:hypothetical protein